MRRPNKEELVSHIQGLKEKNRGEKVHCRAGKLREIEKAIPCTKLRQADSKNSFSSIDNTVLFFLVFSKAALMISQYLKRYDWLAFFTCKTIITKNLPVDKLGSV